MREGEGRREIEEFGLGTDWSVTIVTVDAVRVAAVMDAMM